MIHLSVSELHRDDSFVSRFENPQKTGAELEEIVFSEIESKDQYISVMSKLYNYNPNNCEKHITKDKVNGCKLQKTVFYDKIAECDESSLVDVDLNIQAFSDPETIHARYSDSPELHRSSIAKLTQEIQKLVTKFRSKKPKKILKLKDDEDFVTSADSPKMNE